MPVKIKENELYRHLGTTKNRTLWENKTGFEKNMY